MKIFDRYIFRSFLGPLILTFLIVIFVLIMQFLWLYIDDLVGKGLGMKVILEFMMWGSATLIPLALPLATLLASIMTLGGLGENNELLAMKASGISLQRLLAPLIVFAVVICIGAFFASNDLIPLAYKNIYALRDDITRTKEEIRIPNGIFYNGIDNYTLRVTSNDKETGMMYGIMVYNHSNRNGNTSVTLADSGSIRLTADKQNIIFNLHHGQTYEEGKRKNWRDTTYPMQRIRFENQEIIIPLDNHAFKRGDDERFGNEIMAQNLKSLGHRRDSLDSLYTIAKTDFKQKILPGSGFDFANQLDTAQNKGFGTLFPIDSLPPAADELEQVEIINRVIEKIDRLMMYIDSFVMEDIQYNNPLRKTSLEWFRKFSLSFACLIFFFIGAPLGAIIRKGGLGTPVVVSMFFFVIYWVVDISGKKLATDGTITPALGAWISSAVLLPMGVFLTWKATADSSLFSPESYMKFIKKIRAFFKKTEQKQMKIVFMGTPDFAAGVLSYLVEHNYQVAGVVTAPDKMQGRGLGRHPSAVKTYALAHHLRILQPVNLKDPQFIEDLSILQADLFVVVAFRILPAIIWKMPVYGCFNLHASLLPQYRGAAPINRALMNGETRTGLTTFFIDDKIDTGQILLQQEIDIAPDDTFGSLHDKLMQAGGPIVADTIDLIAGGHHVPRVQQTPEVLHPAPKIFPEDCKIDFRRPAREIHNQIRGLSPVPGAFAELQIETDKPLRLKIFASAYDSEEHSLTPGTILSDRKTCMKIACGEGFLSLLQVQAPGRKRLGIKEFLAGYRPCKP